MSAIKRWFPTHIYYAPLLKSRGNDFRLSLLEECYQLKDYDRKGRAWSKKNYVGGYTSYSSLGELHKFSSTFGELEKHIDKHVQSYLRALDFDLRGQTIQMTDCWLNIMPAQTTHSGHIHPLSLISGTYYVQTPPKAAAIKFEDPRVSRMMNALPKKAKSRSENQHHVSYPARAGNVVLFESWLRHEVPASENAQDRISVSFNYNWR